MRAYDGGEHADNDGLTPGQRQTLSTELAGERAALAETDAWTELLRLCVRFMLSSEVDARGDGLARDMAFAKLQSRILSAAEAVQAAKLHHDMPPEQQANMLSAGRTWHWHVLDGHAQITDRTGTECAMEGGHGVTARCNAGCRPALHVCFAKSH